MWEEFKKFVMRGSVVDLAVGVIIGGAFGSIVSSLVNDIIMPPIGLLLGKVDFSNLYLILRQGDPPAPYASLTEAQELGAVTMNYGIFINALVSFIIVAFAVFLLIRAVNRLQQAAKKAEETEEASSTKACPFCQSQIHLAATRCPYCTSQLE